MAKVSQGYTAESLLLYIGGIIYRRGIENGNIMDGIRMDKGTAAKQGEFTTFTNSIYL